MSEHNPRPAAPIPASEVLRVLDMIGEDMYLDTVAADGKPFTGKVVAEQLAEIRATIQALSNMLYFIVNEQIDKEK